MTGEDFLLKLQKMGTLSEMQSILDYHAKPPGRRNKSAEELKLSSWINGLDAESKRNLEFLMESAADNAIFGLLCILDGVRGGEESKFELSHIDRTGERTVLNGPRDKFLHDVYRDLFPPVRP